MNAQARKMRIKEVKKNIHQMQKELDTLIDECEHVPQQYGFEGMWAKCSICHIDLGDWCEESPYNVCEYDDYVHGEQCCSHCGRLEEEK